MSHDHGHGLSASAQHAPRLRWAFLVTLGFFVVELVAGILTSSLALISDAGHMLTDVAGMGMALAAIAAARRPAPSQRSFGLYRLEILAALANAVLLLGVAGYVVLEAVRRFQDPPAIPGGAVLLVGAVGLAANLVALALLRTGSRDSLNVKGAYLEVVADLLGSVGVILAAVVLLTTGWPYADPIIAAAIGLFIVPRSVRLGWEALRVLVQAAPRDMAIDDLRGDLAAIPGVVDVHDLHVWTLTSAMDVASAHLMTATGTDAHGVLDEARALLRDRYGLAHATLQVEPETHEGCEELSW